MIDRDHELPLTRQAELLRLSRGSLYYQPRAVPAADLAIMRRIDELHLDYPFAGSRMLRDLLRGEGIAVGRERVAAMMRRMGIEALYRRPHTSKPADGRKIYPSAARLGGGAGEPGMGHGHHLHSHGPRLRLLGCRGGLVQSAGARLAGVDHAGGRVLYRRGRGGAGTVRQADDVQHRQ
jgi:hypothetical protein